MRRMHRRDGDAEDSEQDDEDTFEWGAAEAGEGKKLAGIARLRRRYARHPEALCRAYVALVRSRLNITDPRSAWRMVGYAKQIRPQFGKHTGLWRIHYALSLAIHEGAILGRPAAALALVAQTLKAIHQSALNNGSWATAQLLMPFPDPVGNPRFAGSLSASHQDAMRTVGGAPPRPGAPSAAVSSAVDAP